MRRFEATSGRQPSYHSPFKDYVTPITIIVEMYSRNAIGLIGLTGKYSERRRDSEKKWCAATVQEPEFLDVNS